MYKLSIILVPLFLISSVFAQSEEDVIVEDGQVSEQEIPNNNFENLVPVDQLVVELRENYGLKGSVYLTKTLWQILTSYSNQEQSQNSWQTSIKEVTKLDQTLLPTINFQFNSGQVLSKFTFGMDMAKWQNSRVGIKVTDKNLDNFLKLNDDLTVYLHLKEVWSVFLKGIQRQESIVWSDVFEHSLSLFDEQDNEKDTEVLKTDTGITEQSVANMDKQFFNALNDWENSDKKALELAALINVIESFNLPNQNNNQFYVSVLRYSLNKQQLHYLASSLSWFEVVYHLYNRKQHLDEKIHAVVLAFIEDNDVWFLSKEAEMMAVNMHLPEMVESTIHGLKQFYQLDNPLEEQAPAPVVDVELPHMYQLIEPLFVKYMATPFRQKTRKQLEVCLNISEEFSPYPQQPIDIKQFNGCVLDMAQAAVVEAKTRELSGSLTKIDTKQALDRALQSPAWQTINILKARVAEINCLDDSHQSVNPLEWTLGAESLLWFIDRWPAYFASYHNSNSILKIIQAGEKLQNGLDCIEQSTEQILAVEFSQIEQAWQNVKTQINQVIEEFNQLNLTPGSDLDLFSNTDKASNYRVEDEEILACDAQKSCGVHVSLNSSRALYGLFPNHLLVADQLKLGKLKLCYDNVGWQDRRSASTHLENPSVANYFGRFSFSLKGFYNEALVFERKLNSKDEYYYLFGANNEEVLSTYCPLSIVGDKISTKLDRGTFGMVPNRLTFLTASRASESNILTGNWSAGEEWQDQIAAPETLLVSENGLTDLAADIQLAYLGKAKELQDLIYQTVLNRIQNPSEKQQLLNESFAEMQRMSKLFSHMVYITQSDEYMSNDQLHSIFFGNDKIPDIFTIIGFYKNQLNINQFISSMDENMKINQNKWNTFTPTWSNAYLNNLLYRLKSL